MMGQCQGNWVGKSLSYWHAKSWDCLLTHLLPMKSILFFIRRIYCYQFRCNYLRTKKCFSQFFAAILKSRLNFEYFEKRMTLTGFVFAKLRTLKAWLKKMSKKSCFRGPFDKQYGKRAEGLFKSVAQILYQIHRPLPSQWSWKKSLSLTCQILGLLVNTLATNKKYPVLHRENLRTPIHMQLSQKQKNLFSIFCRYSKI